MPLEDLIGSKYINNLNETWPLGTDLANAGDDHLRGIKNVLKKTFPNLTGPVTRTQDSLNNGSVPVGAVTTFYAATAPVGWERITVDNVFMLRIVPTSGTDSDAGGSGGGEHDPTYNDHIPYHVHSVSANTTDQSAFHTHHVDGSTVLHSAAHSHHVEANTTQESAYHTHGFSVNIAIPRGLYATGPSVYFGAAQDGTLTIGDSGTTGGESATHVHTLVTDTSVEGQTHSHTFTAETAGESVSHTHGINTQTSANTGETSVWRPHYLNFILCRRT